MSEKTKKQHYVWEFYLKGWATDDQIWCKRAGKPFKTSTENVAQERYFYELEPLSPAEITLLNNIINRGSSINRVVNLNGLNAYILIANSKGDIPRFSIERHHSMIEGKADPVLKALRSGSAEILKDKQSKIDLCIYLGHQYTRTKKVRNSFTPIREDLTIPEKYISCDFKKIHRALSFIYANAIGSSVFEHLDLRLVKNQSGTKLITSDQPIYNLLAIPGDISKESSIYFPISPELALWAKKGPNEERIDTKEKAESLNAFIAGNALEFVFATSEEELTAF